MSIANKQRSGSQLEPVVEQAAGKPRHIEPVDVEPEATLERLAKRFKREATLNRKICRQRSRDSDYYFGIAEGLLRAATTLTAVAKEKALQREVTKTNT